MSEIYYIADCHFYHKNILYLDKRPFKSIDEMTSVMIANWNAKVQPEDTIYILGDLSFDKAGKTIDLLSKLNGHKHLIRGNHDYYLQNTTTHGFFESIQDYAEIIDNRRRVVLCHYPIPFYYKQWKGSYMLHGHIHNTKDQTKLNDCLRMMHEKDSNEPFNLINCFCGYSDYTPLTLNEWCEISHKKPYKIS